MEEINSQIKALSVERDAIQVRIKQLTAQRNQIEAQQNAANMVNGMSDDQKRALAQAIGVPSINSTTQFGQM